VMVHVGGEALRMRIGVHRGDVALRGPAQRLRLRGRSRRHACRNADREQRLEDRHFPNPPGFYVCPAFYVCMPTGIAWKRPAVKNPIPFTCKRRTMPRRRTTEIGYLARQPATVADLSP
jgi:hypothetical protein